VWGHSKLWPHLEDCNYGGYPAIRAWGDTYGMRARSESYGWMQASSPFFYGNLVFGSLRWLRSVEVRHVTQFLFESLEWSGYFRNRWGDQAVWPQLVGFFYDVPDLANSSLICDLTEWRSVHFWHW
jgi:hypothetical protein